MSLAIVVVVLIAVMLLAAAGKSTGIQMLSWCDSGHMI